LACTYFDHSDRQTDGGVLQFIQIRRHGLTGGS
jgi:hypothetical protein